MRKLKKIISGGQTGVDRAALDVALDLNIPCGGWCPKGRKAEDGTLDPRYPLKETPSADYEQRTEWNVRDSDGTLILTNKQPTGGTALTIEYAKQQDKPILIFNLRGRPSSKQFMAWLRKNKIRILNIAGPRESQASGFIYSKSRRVLERLLA